MSNVEQLRVLEEPVIEFAPITALTDRVGIEESREVIEKAIFELSDRLWLLEKAFYDSSLDDAKEVTHGLCDLAQEFGLVEFSKVAGDLVQCILRTDYVATQAVATRLVRVGERSLYKIVQSPYLNSF